MDKEEYNCQMEGKPCQRWCGANPCLASAGRDERIYTKADMEAACELVRGANRMAKRISLDKMVDRFLSWPLPASVCSDACVVQRGYPHRIGTNLLTADEARQMLEYVLSNNAALPPLLRGLDAQRVEHDWTKCERVRCHTEEVCTRPQACFAGERADGRTGIRDRLKPSSFAGSNPAQPTNLPASDPVVPPQEGQCPVCRLASPATCPLGRAHDDCILGDPVFLDHCMRSPNPLVFLDPAAPGVDAEGK